MTRTKPSAGFPPLSRACELWYCALPKSYGPGSCFISNCIIKVRVRGLSKTLPLNWIIRTPIVNRLHVSHVIPAPRRLATLVVTWADRVFILDGMPYYLNLTLSIVTWSELTDWCQTKQLKTGWSLWPGARWKLFSWLGASFPTTIVRSS